MKAVESINVSQMPGTEHVGRAARRALRAPRSGSGITTFLLVYESEPRTAPLLRT